MIDDVRATYLAAAETVVALLTDEVVARRWGEGSVLAGMSVGALAAHLARSVLQVDWYLDAPAVGGPLISAVDYYAQLQETASPTSELNRGVRTRSEQTAAAGSGELARQSCEALIRLRERLALEPAYRRVPVVHRPGQELLLDEYLRTRCVEFAVHTEDLAVSLGSDVRAPAAAVAVAIDVLVTAARRRHGDEEVLHALTRRERDRHDALRVV